MTDTTTTTVETPTTETVPMEPTTAEITHADEGTLPVEDPTPAGTLPVEPVEPPKELTKEEKKKADAEAKAKEKADAEAKKNEVDPADVQKYEYLTRLLNINTEMSPAEVIRYDQIIQHTGFTPDLLLEIIKDPKCAKNTLNGELLIEGEDLLIISKALSKKISKDVNSYTERDRAPKTWILINKYGINLTDLKGGVSKLAEKVIDPKTEKIDEESIDLIVKGFEAICLK